MQKDHLPNLQLVQTVELGRHPLLKDRASRRAAAHCRSAPGLRDRHPEGPSGDWAWPWQDSRPSPARRHRLVGGGLPCRQPVLHWHLRRPAIRQRLGEA